MSDLFRMTFLFKLYFDNSCYPNSYSCYDPILLIQLKHAVHSTIFLSRVYFNRVVLLKLYSLMNAASFQRQHKAAVQYTVGATPLILQRRNFKEYSNVLYRLSSFNCEIARRPVLRH